MFLLLQCSLVRRHGPLLVYDSSAASATQLGIVHSAQWSQYYRHHERDPLATELSRWLEERLKSFI